MLSDHKMLTRHSQDARSTGTTFQSTTESKAESPPASSWTARIQTASGLSGWGGTGAGTPTTAPSTTATRLLRTTRMEVSCSMDVSGGSWIQLPSFTRSTIPSMAALRLRRTRPARSSLSRLASPSQRATFTQSTQMRALSTPLHRAVSPQSIQMSTLPIQPRPTRPLTFALSDPSIPTAARSLSCAATSCPATIQRTSTSATIATASRMWMTISLWTATGLFQQSTTPVPSTSRAASVSRAVADFHARAQHC